MKMYSFCNHNPKKVLKRRADLALACLPPCFPPSVESSLQAHGPHRSGKCGEQPAPPLACPQTTARAPEEAEARRRPARRARRRWPRKLRIADWGWQGWGWASPKRAKPARKAQDGNVRPPSEHTEAAPRDVKTTGETSGTKETITEGEEPAQER